MLRPKNCVYRSGLTSTEMLHLCTRKLLKFPKLCTQMQHLCTRKKKKFTEMHVFLCKLFKIVRRCKKFTEMHYSTVAQSHIALHNSCTVQKPSHPLATQVLYCVHSVHNWLIFLSTFLLCLVILCTRVLFWFFFKQNVTVHEYGDAASLYSCNVQHSFGALSEFWGNYTCFCTV